MAISLENIHQHLFEKLEEAVIELRLNERLWGLFIEILQLISSLFNGVDEEDLIEAILNDEQAYDKISRLFTPRYKNLAA